MSQNGANFYAKDGWSYTDILEHYYPGTQVQ
jgi:SpoIID/LytB domain protein